MEHGDTTIEQITSSAIRKCARGELPPMVRGQFFKYGEGVVDGKRYRGLVRFSVSVEIIQAVPS